MMKKINESVLSILVMIIVSIFIIKAGEKALLKQNLQGDRADNHHAVTLTVWYSTNFYEPYLQSAAERYQELYGSQVVLKQISAFEYLSEIRQANVLGEGPDIFLTDNTYLQQLVWSGVAAKTVFTEQYTKKKFCEGTFTQLMYQGECYGYPLGFDAVALMYHPSLVKSVPGSFAEIYEMTEGENSVSPDMVLQWDGENFLYNYSFVAAQADVCGKNGYENSVNVNSADMVTAAEQYQKLYAAFAKCGAGSKESILEAFSQGKLLFTLVDGSALKLEERGIEAGFAELPNLDGQLQTASATITDIAMVNIYSKNRQEAEKLARYLSMDDAGEMFSLCSVLPLLKCDTPENSDVFYGGYEKGVGLPKLVATLDFWNMMETALRRIGEKENAAAVLDEQQDRLENQINNQAEKVQSAKAQK